MKKKKIIVSIVGIVLAIALIASLVTVFKKANAPDLSVSTQYKIEEVTVGDVNTTISGSGSLTPVTSKNFTAVELLEELAKEETEDAEDSESDVSAQNQSGLGPETGGKWDRVFQGDTMSLWTGCR